MRAWVWAAGLAGGVLMGAWVFVVASVLPVLIDRDNLPDLEPLMRFEFRVIGHVYDARGEPLIALARERRQITRYADLPPVIRDAIVAAEDKRFFAHPGVDIYSLPRVMFKVRFGAWVSWFAAGSERDNAAGRAVFPQGGSTITQQLVRGVFLQQQTARENSYELRSQGRIPRLLSWIAGARNVNMLLRKREEIRLSLWLEQQMAARFGSQRRGKEEILARYASFVYMGNGRYGVDRAAEHYFSRKLSTFTSSDADQAALLAGIAKSPRAYAPTSADPRPILRRRNQILALMAAQGFLSAHQQIDAAGRPLPVVARRLIRLPEASAVVEHAIDELTTAYPDLGIEDLLQGNIQIYTTVNEQVQQIASEALEHGLERYEKRHPKSRGRVQGAVVVLSNADGRVLAEVGGRRHYGGVASSYSDFNRARIAMRQPGSAMKPFVYLAAFRFRNFTLDTLVPDEPISVPDGRPDVRKWIANYDGQFKGLMPMRIAFAESRNAVAMWITEQVGIDHVIRTARSVGVRTPLKRYATTALGASEVTLLELASAYRTLASGQHAVPHVLQRVVLRTGEVVGEWQPGTPAPREDAHALSLIQEAMRGVVRLPSGTAHRLDARAFPIAVMGKTGTTSDFKDALFAGSTYGAAGITVAVRIGFDDARSLGNRETGGRLALPVFEEVMMRVYRDGLVGPAPAFPTQMEARITRYLASTLATPAATIATAPTSGAAAQVPDDRRY